ncbi:LysM-like peptidoglycan binding protein [Arthrobacter phage Altadena]|uniref:LysM-like peptidoglycan binding protein n=1 Tax=Arthrobacter phage Altadena TaxID=3059064 RepID=A0AA96HTJ7_9CAUD|nr:LysM-like peptidoglycan binding protein [Arthrobacter phage Altadena]
MTAVRILTARPTRPGRLILISKTGAVLPFPTTPPSLTYSNGAEFGAISRPGKKAVTRRTGYGLRRLGFKQVVASLDYEASIEAVVRKFDEIAGAGNPVRFNGGAPGFEQKCWWDIKGFSVEVLSRARNNEASKVEISWDLEEHVDVAVSLARIVAPRPVRKPAPALPKPSRTHTVVRGDTLWGIAARYLGNGARWPEIHRLNLSKIRNPHWIYPGQVFRIP